jgi:mycoredoxin
MLVILAHGTDSRAKSGRREAGGPSGCCHPRKYPEMRRQRVSQPVTMYSTQWCAYCRRLKSQLGRDGIEIVEVDIERDPEAANYVISVNGGNMTVPTVVFPDGTVITNPSAAQVKERLGKLAVNG